MMYDSKFVTAIKVNGKILKETKDLVQLPFGSEFSVLVKNLNSRRAKFTLHIDGADALDGEEIIVNANSEVEMKRFIRAGNMDSGNAFKFIERTAKIEDGPRGIKMDDGVVRVQFWFEKQPDQTITTYHKDIWWNNYGYYPYYPYSTYNGWNNIKGTLGTSSILRGMDSVSSITSASLSGDNSITSNAVFSNATAQNTSTTMNSVTMDANPTVTDSFEVKKEMLNDTGITVPGSKVEQKFTPVYGFNSEEISNVIIIRLAGKIGETPIEIPITVKAKQKCSTCGHTNKANAKFCGECGTALELL